MAEGTDFAGYTIVRCLGSGGMGEVYVAQHPRLPRQDALKVLRPEMSTNQEFRERFLREADLTAALSHPNIVGVYDRGEFDGQLWISMEYVDGTDVSRLLRSAGGVSDDQAVAIISAVADGHEGHVGVHGEELQRLTLLCAAGGERQCAGQRRGSEAVDVGRAGVDAGVEHVLDRPDQLPSLVDAVIVTAAMDEATRSAWCRESGVYLQQLQQWRASATQALAAP